MLPTPSLLSSLLWRPCSPPALGTAVIACKEMLDGTAKAAWPELQVNFPGICMICTSVEKLGTCAAACSQQAGGVEDTSNCSANLNSLLGL